MKDKQRYTSQLRQEQTKHTRELILEGLIKTMAQGITEISIPAVAREAGVSVPTVYRYFRTKRELVEALNSYIVEKAGIAGESLQQPHSPQELAQMIKRMYMVLEGQDDAMRALSMSELSNQMRKEAIPFRFKLIEEALAPVANQFNEADWQRLCRLMIILCSSATARAFQNYLDLSGEEAADIVAWAILTLARASSRTNEEHGEEGATS